MITQKATHLHKVIEGKIKLMELYQHRGNEGAALVLMKEIEHCQEQLKKELAR